ncbi:M56 family metallopeptidase [Seonamhaeicola marinus]|uniref:BlaR1 peptidase M56 family protein n=1 Tax=Seonamhaeicola marinus TaxID=1912246 RepID=A0A5D0HF00_9FLAO|nr:M56 family metallopeptidase [Seonamhaeicola marinus]TYA69964.1 blaR1 peptidase M56 family protein [Seonamhaeicola marinus]
MFQYIIQTIGFQLFFLLVYDFVLKRETFFNWNRVYLLGTSVLSLLIPLIRIEGFKNAISKDFIVTLPEVFIGNQEAVENPIQFNLFELEKSTSVFEILFYIGFVIAACLFLFKFFKILKLLVNNPKQKSRGYKIVSLSNSTAAFSFFKYIFLGELIDTKEKDVIIKHEMIHVKQYHSFDLLFFEVLRLLLWFNPLIYMYQNRMVELHEFIADAHAVKDQNKADYYENLLQQVFNTQKISFINPFFKQSLIKKRIVMLSKSKSKKTNLLKYALLIPMVIGMLAYASSSKELEHTAAVNYTKKTPLLEKIHAVKTQIAIQGNVSENEENMLNLLLETLKGSEFNQEYINKVNKFLNSKWKSKLENKIAAVFEQIQVQGNISNEEETALKHLLVLTSEEGLNDPFFADILKDVKIPFGVTDKVPSFPGCEDLSANEQKQCFAENVSKHINRNFNTKLAAEHNLKGKQRINVIFIVNNEGNITGVRARAPHPALVEEAKRVIQSLPKMIPGEHQGKTINVPYSCPIIFQVNDDKKKK